MTRSRPRFSFAAPPAPLVATVSVLNSLESVATSLWAVLERFACADASPAIPIQGDPDRRLALEGSLAVFEGPPEQACRMELALRERGLTTSLNLRPVPLASSSR